MILKFFSSYAGKGARFLKKAKIGFSIVNFAFKSIIFKHNKYFIFCLILTLTHLLNLYLINIISNQFSLIIYINNFLLGQNFFEQIQYNNLNDFIMLTVLYFIQYFFINYINATVIYYSQNLNKQSDLKKSFYKSFEKINFIALWVLLDFTVQYITSNFYNLGNSIYFLWQLSTAFILPIIMFYHIKFTHVLTYSILAFKERFASLFVADAYFELLLIIGTFIFQLILQYDKSTPFGLSSISTPYQFGIASIIFYISYCFNVAECIAISAIYTKRINLND